MFCITQVHNIKFVFLTIVMIYGITTLASSPAGVQDHSGWKTDRYTRQRYRDYLVGIGEGIRVSGSWREERKGKRDRGTEKERKEEEGREKKRLPLQKKDG